MIWTDEKHEELRRLVSEGKSSSEIAAIFGTTTNAICGRKHKLGIKGGKAIRFYTPEEILKIRQMRFARKPMKIIARAIGRSPSAIQCKLSTLNAERRMR